eukprot:733964-Prymnesium_polylepis.1
MNKHKQNTNSKESGKHLNNVEEIRKPLLEYETLGPEINVYQLYVLQVCRRTVRMLGNLVPLGSRVSSYRPYVR